MKRVTHYLSAFTLIELLVVVAIVGITSAVILVDWGSARTTQQVESAAGEVEAVVREAQSYALTGYQGTPNTEPCGMKFVWSTSDYGIEYQYKDSNGCNGTLAMRNATLKSGVTFSGGGGSLTFLLPHATFGGVKHTIGVTKSGVDAVVCVYESGRIESLSGVSSCP